MLRACWKRVESSLNWFKLSFNIDSTFPLFSKMLNGVQKSFEHFCSTIVEHTHAHIRLQKTICMASIVCVNNEEVDAMLEPFERAFAQLCFCIQHLTNILSTFLERMLVKCWNCLNGPILASKTIVKDNNDNYYNLQSVHLELQEFVKKMKV